MAEPESEGHADEGLARQLEEAVELVRRAGELTLGYFRSSHLDVEQKADGSPVTKADRQAERLIREELEMRYPGDGIVGEEEGVKPGETGQRWFVDPIDGTIAFTRGVGTYTNLLALEDEHVSQCEALSESYLSTSAFDNWQEAALLALKRAGVQLRTWSDGFGYALVATGRVDAMTDMETQPYDVAPMPVILSEAGGRFSDLSGALRHDGGSALASNGRVHDELLRLLVLS